MYTSYATRASTLTRRYQLHYRKNNTIFRATMAVAAIRGDTSTLIHNDISVTLQYLKLIQRDRTPIVAPVTAPMQTTSAFGV